MLRFRGVPKCVSKGIKKSWKKFPEEYFKSRRVRIVVAGEAGTGKTTFILACFNQSVEDVERCFGNSLPRMLPIMHVRSSPHTVLDSDLVMVDTEPSVQDIRTLTMLGMVDVVVLTYACDRKDTFDKLLTTWIPLVDPWTPLLVVGCKFDLADENPLMTKEIETEIIKDRPLTSFFHCSRYNLSQVRNVLFEAERHVLFPKDRLFMLEEYNPKAGEVVLNENFQPGVKEALLRIFCLIDHDNDNFVDDEDLSNYQVKCFGSDELWENLSKLKDLYGLPISLYERGLTPEGFLRLHALAFEQCHHKLFMVLKAFGYNIHVKLAKGIFPSSLKQTSAELSKEAIWYLIRIFHLYDMDQDGALSPLELQDVFSFAPECPFSEAPYKDAAECDLSGSLSLDGFLSLWALMTRLNPNLSFENLLYIGYDGMPSSAIHQSVKGKTQKSVLQCFVFGPRNSALLDFFLGRECVFTSSPTSNERYAVNVLSKTKKTLVLREIPADKVEECLEKKSLAACDVAVFVYDSSDELSKSGAAELLKSVSKRCEDYLFDVPCLYVEAKNDPVSFAVQNGTTEFSDSNVIFDKIAEAAKTEPETDTEFGDLNNLFCEAGNAAEFESEAGRTELGDFNVFNIAKAVQTVTETEFGGLIKFFETESGAGTIHKQNDRLINRS